MDSITNMEARDFPNRSGNIAALAAALSAAQKNFASIPKDREVTVTTQTGGTYKFRYATLDAILAATMPALAEQGLALSQALTEWGSNYAVETRLFHSSGEWINNVTPMFLSGRRTKDGRELPPGNQELGSAQSFARRYGVSALLCITADEDDDSNHADGNHADSQRIPFKPGARGSAGSGTQFRPERRAHTGKSWIDDEAHLVDTTREKGTMPAKPAAAAGNAIKRIAWVKASVEHLATCDEHMARDWWHENKPRIDIIETALPTEFERLLDAYNEALERKVGAL